MPSPATVDSLPVFSGTQIRWRMPWRQPLWLALLGLTARIVSYPVNLRLESFPILSPDVFPNLLLFGVLFYLWALSLLVLLFTPYGEGSAKWERLALVALAALVFRGFWNIIAPVQGQGLAHVTATKVWQELGHVVPHAGAAYVDWPGLSLASSALSQITGHGLILSSAILTVFTAIVIAIAAYVFLLGVLNSSLTASIACLLILEGSLTLIISYNPGPMGLALVVLFLAVLFQKEALETPPSILVALLLLTAAAVIHFHSASHFFFILLGIWGLTLLRRRQAELGPTGTVLALFFIVPVAWLFYWGIGGFISLTHWSGAVFSDPFSIADRLVNVFTIGQANFGESLPLWFSRTRLFWFAVLYVPGGLLWLWRLRTLHRLDPRESTLAAAFSGLVLLGVIGSLVSPNGFAELRRLMTAGAFFLAPFLLSFIQKLKPLATKATLLGLAGVLGALSLPSFLANNVRINSDSVHRTEYAAGKWLQSQYGAGETLHVFVTSPTLWPVQFYTFAATYVTESNTHQFKSWNEESLWQAMDELLDRFDRSSRSGNSSFFISSAKMAVVMKMTFGIPVDHPRWGNMINRLAERYDRVYHNGPIRIDRSRGRFSQDSRR